MKTFINKRESDVTAVTCRKKTARGNVYRTPGEAHKVEREIHKACIKRGDKVPKRLQVFLCDCCNKYHLGKSVRRQRKTLTIERLINILEVTKEISVHTLFELLKQREYEVTMYELKALIRTNKRNPVFRDLANKITEVSLGLIY